MKLVLVVEDNEDIREMAEMHLSLGGHACISAENRNVAMELIRKGLRPDLILMDLMMYGMTIEEFNARMTSLGLEVPMILATCSPDGERLAGKMGAYFLPKAYSSDDLMKTIDLCFKE